MSIINVRSKIEEKDIDLSALDVGMKEAFIKSVGNIAKMAHNEWITIAQSQLRTSRHIYINGVQKDVAEGLRSNKSFITRIQGTTTAFEIALIGDMPNNFEFGMNSFDMKNVRPGWLGGSKARTAKDGSRYVIIPFRHSLTSAARLDYTGKAKRMDLRTELKKTVREYGLDKMVRTGAGAVIPGPVKRVPNSPNVHQYLKGLTRVQSPSGGTTRGGSGRGSSQLVTWRTMSENSASSAWIHPGVKAANIMPQVERWIDSELDKTIKMMFG